MNNTTILTKRICFLILIYVVVCMQSAFGQETASTQVNSKSTYHNQLFFNRFLINPTFSLVRENKSYINILHRNQYATFEDNDQNYFLGFSNKLNDRTALGMSVYSQWSGVVQEFGFNANYATAVKLGEKNKLTFGTNLTYFTEGLDQNRVVVADEDNRILDAKKESKIAIQPAVTLSLGQFDFGLYAEDLFKYNQTTNDFLTNLSTNSVKASVQYTYEFMQNRGLFANARLMPLVQVGQNVDGSLNYIGSMLLDLPEYGWFQTNFDQEYGLSLGLGFNLSKKMSLGYLLERDLMNEETDLGWNHEVTLAYTLDREHNSKGLFAEGSEDEKIDRIVRNYEEQILALKEEAANNKKTSNKRGTVSQVADRDVLEAMAGQDETDANALAYENRLILDEMILRQDSIDAARTAAFEQRLESLVDVLRTEIKKNMNGDTKQEEQSSYKTGLAATELKPKKETKAPSEALKTEEIAKISERNNAALATTHLEKKNEVKTNEVVAENQIHKSVDAFFDAAAKSRAAQRKALVSAKTETKPVVTEEATTAGIKDYAKLPVKVLSKEDFVDVKSGYYVIANVYKNKKYLNAFMADLKKKGINAKQFFNKQNGLHYVYLADYNYKEEAKTAYVSNLDGKYNDEKWIMQVDDHSAIVDNMYEDQ